MVCFSFIGVVVIAIISLADLLKRHEFEETVAAKEKEVFVHECLDGIKTVVAFNKEERVMKKFEYKSQEYLQASVMHKHADAFVVGSVRTLIFVFLLFGLSLGSLFVEKGTINPNTNNIYKVHELLAIIFLVLVVLIYFLRLVPNAKSISKAKHASQKLGMVIERKEKNIAEDDS